MARDAAKGSNRGFRQAKASLRPLPSLLADVFVEWAGLAPDDQRPVLEIQETGCFDLHGLHWQESFIARERRHRICHYRAPDAESVRIAFRQGGVPIDAIWTGTVHAGVAAAVNVVVERKFRSRFPRDAASALESLRAEWLEPYGYTLVSAIVPCGRERIICLCRAPAPVSRLPDDEDGVSIWACRPVRADSAVP